MVIDKKHAYILTQSHAQTMSGARKAWERRLHDNSALMVLKRSIVPEKRASILRVTCDISASLTLSWSAARMFGSEEATSSISVRQVVNIDEMHERLKE